MRDHKHEQSRRDAPCHGATRVVQRHVSGQRVNQAALGPGDRITIGVTDLTFELD